MSALIADLHKNDLLVARVSELCDRIHGALSDLPAPARELVGLFFICRIARVDGLHRFRRLQEIDVIE
jgi:hypothetical protein